MPSLDFEVYCKSCGADLRDDIDVNGLIVKVEPCFKCMCDEFDRGLIDGYEEIMERILKKRKQ